MQTRRTFRRRLMIIGTVTGLCALATVLLFSGIYRLQKTDQYELNLQNIQIDALSYISKMYHELALMQHTEGSSAEAVLGFREECEEVLIELEEEFGKMLKEQPAFGKMQEEWDELQAANSEREWTRFSTDLDAFEGHFNRLRNSLSEQLALDRQAALMLYKAGIIILCLALLLCLWLLLTVVSDVASEAYNTRNLKKEVSSLADETQFQARIKLLFPDVTQAKIENEWELSLDRVVREKRTHICFEATATNGERKIKIWGRRYKWAGYIKSFQRIFFPAFAEATWRTLCLMYNNEVNTPTPIIYKRLRSGPFKAGGIILMEHVGDVESVKSFFRSEFSLLDPKQQNDFIERVISFIKTLHELGIYGLKPRYLHGKSLYPYNENPEICLFDLDKVLVWPSCPSFAAKLLRRKDNRRLVRELKSALDVEQVKKFNDRL